MKTLTSRFANAVQWNIATSLATAVVQLGIVGALARLLTPSDFGRFAIANVVFTFAVHLSQPGLNTAIVREPSLDRGVIGSVVSLSVGVAILFGVICFSVAPLIASGANLFDQSLVQNLVRLTALTIFISGLSLPAQAIMARELRYRTLGLAQFAGI